MTANQILVVDDEPQMRNLIRIYLKRQGYLIHEAQNGIEALQWLNRQPIDLVILDIMMPEMDGYAVCTEIRRIQTLPILMLTARSETKDRITGLNLGADDYLIKPFDPGELIARVGALLRRVQQLNIPTPSSITQPLTFEDMTIYPDRREIHIQNQLVDFTPKEYDILYLLASNPHRVFTRDHIVEQLWSFDYNGDVRSVDNHVKNIREKAHRANLAFSPIQTAWGVGYKFQSGGH